jgi:mRNA interferase RelE/StbE
MKYRIVLTPTALQMLHAISDRRIRDAVRDRIDGLADDPHQQGKALMGELAGYRSPRAVGQRYRILYRTEEARVVVLVVAVGIRKEKDRHDIYALAKRVIRLGLITPSIP